MLDLLRHARWLAPLVILGCADPQLGNSHAGVATSVSAEAWCELLGEDEALVGVSPGGEAWVQGDAGMRQVSPDRASNELDARFTRSDVLVGWDASSAFVIGDNALWSATLAGSEPLALPPELGKPISVCGDPRDAGGAFLVTTRGLFERRDEAWLRWAVPVELLESMEIRDLQGACSGEDAVMYIEAGGSLWEARHGDAASFREIASLSEMSRTGVDDRVGFVAVREGELLRFDDGWEKIPFDEGSVSQMSIADSVLWVSVGTDLYRRDRFEKWELLETATWPAPISVLESYAAGGAWLVKGAQLCHVGHRETLRVDGVRPYERLPSGSTLSLDVIGDPAMGSALSVRLDGQTLPVTGSPGSWTVAEVGALEAGWHSLSLNAASAEGVVRRTVKFLIEGEADETPVPMPDPTVSWERDIRPIYETRCAVCHGEDGNQSFLGSYEAFSTLGEVALDLVSRGEMPPASAVGLVEPLDAGDIALIETWVQEGMGP